MPLTKPHAPVWQPGRAPAGCKLHFPLAEGAGTRVRDLARANHGTFAGAPTWSRGPYGPRLGGFTATDYVPLDPAPALVFPFWQAYLFVNTSTSQGTLGGWTNTEDTNPVVAIRVNSGGVSGVLNYFLRDDAGTTAVVDATLAATYDGSPRVAMAVSYSAADHRLYLDGLQVASSTTSIIAVTVPAFTLGALRRTSVALAFPGSLIAAAAGTGAAPSPAALAADWLSGRFSADRPRSNLATLAAATVVPPGGGVTMPVFQNYYRRRRGMA